MSARSGELNNLRGLNLNRTMKYLADKSEQEAKQQLFEDMVAFLDELPPNSEMDCNKDKDFLFHFEASRLLLVRDTLLACGVKPDDEMAVLDFGYLDGLFQEFLHRFFPKARLDICDRPASGIFTDEAYLKLICGRKYLNLIARDINDLDVSMGPYRVVILGEIIEHLDPTCVMEVLRKLRKVVSPGGVLLITTPNAAGLYHCWMTLRDKDRVQVAPIPDPLHGLGHIHLWSGRILRQTAEHVGWAFNDICYYHGREGEKFAQARRTWGDLKGQVLLRAIEFLASRTPRYRGYFVATFIAR